MAIILDPNLELELLQKAQNQDADAFGRLYDAYIKKIYAFIYYKTLDQETAEDISSLVFMKAWKNINQFKQGSFAAWLYTIARHAVTDHYRRQTKTVDIEDCWDLADDTDLINETDKAMRLADIKKALAKLKSREREIIIMRLWLDLPFQEIAQRLEQKEGAVKMAFSRALSRLKNEVPLHLLILAPLIIGGGPKNI